MKSRILLCIFVSFLVLTCPVYGYEYLADMGDGYDGEAGEEDARWIRVKETDGDIVSDIGTFTHLYVSRDNGRTWEAIFENASKEINWVGATGSSVLGTATIPAGTYNYCHDIQSSEIVRATVNDGTHGEKVINIDITGGELDDCKESCNFTLENNGSATLRFDDPIIQVDVLIKWNDSTSTYDVEGIANDISRAEQTGSRFAD